MSMLLASTMTSSAGLALAAMMTTMTALPVWAQTTTGQTPQVEIVAPGTDARTLCPSIDADLVAALSRVAWVSRRSAELDVRFDLDGRQVGDVVVRGGSDAYRQATRRAVKALDCDGGRSGPQEVHLQVVFTDL